uniref:Polymerase PB2 n=1 Tax=Hemipteran orthomyxo-related virus OKIAV188 TaxID=2746271 RepID=A0A7D7EY94_9ORTO|nr:polymerase PB2 [Hemipteran orthomyxo-related virus OKIAV188]
MDEEREEKNMKKTVLMFLCDKILNCSKEAINIMKHKPINSFRVITRNARNTRDPNPLQTMLMTLSTPYPLAIDRQKAIQYDIPNDYLKKTQGGKFTEDNHYKGRILAKRETIDWWLSYSPLPNKTGIEIIDVLRSFNRKEVKLYRSINWSATRIQFGRCSLQRVRVPTRKVDFKLSKEQRDASIEQIFAPDSTIPYIEIPSSVMKAIKEVLKKHTHASMLLATQIRILANQMDPNYRFLLMQPGAGETTATLRHGLHQRTWEVTGITFEEDSQLSEVNSAVKNICDAFLDIAMNHTQDYDRAKSVLSGIKIFNIPLSSALREGTVPNVDSTKLVKSILEIPFLFEHQYSGVNFSPDDSVLMEVNKTMGNIEYKAYLGREKVFFEYQDTRGYFVHNADSFYSMVITYSTEEEVRKVFGSIGVYCRIGMINQIHSETLQSAFDGIYQDLYSEPWRLFPQLGKKAFWMIMRGESPNRSKMFEKYLLVREEVEYSKRWSGRMVVKLNPLSIHERGSNKTIFPKQLNRLPIVPPSVHVDDSPFFAYLDPKRRLSSLVTIYLRMAEQLVSNIRVHNFNYYNSCIHQLNRSYLACKFSKLCRAVLRDLAGQSLTEANRGMIAVAYCFAGLHEHVGPEEDELMEPFLLNWVEGITISLLGERGDFISSGDGLTLFGKPISHTGPQRLVLYPGALPGFTIHPYRGEDLPIKGKQWLRENYDVIADGSRFVIFIESERAIARKCNSASLRLVDTVGRQCDERHRGKQKRMSDMVLSHLASKRSK